MAPVASVTVATLPRASQVKRVDGAVGCGDGGAVAVLVVLLAPDGSVRACDLDGEVEGVVLGGGDGAVGLVNRGEVAGFVPGEAGGVTECVGAGEQVVVAVPLLPRGVARGIRFGDDLAQLVVAEGRGGAGGVGVAGEALGCRRVGGVGEAGGEVVLGADGLGDAARGVVDVPVGGVVPVRPGDDAGGIVVGEAQGKAGGVGDLGEVAGRVVAVGQYGDRALGGSQGQCGDAAVARVRGEGGVVAAVVDDRGGDAGLLPDDLDAVAVAVLPARQPVQGSRTVGAAGEGEGQAGVGIGDAVGGFGHGVLAAVRQRQLWALNRQNRFFPGARQSGVDQQ